jgi:hypothetical protein
MMAESSDTFLLVRNKRDSLIKFTVYYTFPSVCLFSMYR